jgi:hypothetical protein
MLLIPTVLEIIFSTTLVIAKRGDGRYVFSLFAGPGSRNQIRSLGVDGELVAVV